MADWVQPPYYSCCRAPYESQGSEPLSPHRLDCRWRRRRALPEDEAIKSWTIVVPQQPARQAHS